jgi:hypothetical protein
MEKALGCKLARLQIPYEGEHAVIGRYKEMATCLSQQRTPGTSDAGVNHCQMDSTQREVTPSLGKGESGFENLVRGNLVRDVYKVSVRTDFENDSLHGGDVVVGSAKVGQKGDDGPVHLN